MEFKAYLQSNGYSTSTIKGHLRNVVNFERWAEQQDILVRRSDNEGGELENITYQDILAYTQQLNTKGINKTTITKYIASIRHYYNYLLQEEQVISNPTLNIQIKGIKKRMVYDILQPVELETLYHKFSTTPLSTTPLSTNPKENTQTKKLKPLNFQMQKVMLGLLIHQGITTGELAALKEEDVKLREGKIYIPQGRRSNDRELKLRCRKSEIKRRKN